MENRNESNLIDKVFFKHYKIKKKIGEGSFGKIFIACNIETQKEYAVKIVSKS